MDHGGQPERQKDSIFSLPFLDHTGRSVWPSQLFSISALIEIKSNDQNFTECINKGQNYLLEKLPELKRASPLALYNVWSHCYGLQALHRMHEISSFSEDRKKNSRGHGAANQNASNL